jgi:hypothetical protein
LMTPGLMPESKASRGAPRSLYKKTPEQLKCLL